MYDTGHRCFDKWASCDTVNETVWAKVERRDGQEIGEVIDLDGSQIISVQKSRLCKAVYWPCSLVTLLSGDV